MRFFVATFLLSSAPALASDNRSQACTIAIEQQRGSWKVYAADLRARFEAAPRGRAHSAAFAEAERRYRLADTAAGTRSDRGGLIAVYAVPPEPGNDNYRTAVGDFEQAWRACHPGAATVQMPAQQHPWLAIVYRRFFERATAPALARMAADTRNTSQIDRGRMTFAAADFAVRVALPFHLEVHDHLEIADKLRRLPPGRDGKSVRALHEALRAVNKEIYQEKGVQAWSAVESVFNDAEQASENSSANVDCGTLPIQQVSDALADAEVARTSPYWPKYVELWSDLARRLVAAGRGR